MKLHGSPKLEPGRPVYVLLHKNQTHVASLPDGTADWDYDKSNMELREQILRKDFNNPAYSVVTLVEALTRVSNKQAELEELWKPALHAIRKKKELTDAWGVYTSALRKLGPHPLRFDAYLRRRFRI